MRRLSVIIEAVPGAGISHDIGTLTRGAQPNDKTRQIGIHNRVLPRLDQQE